MSDSTKVRCPQCRMPVTLTPVNKQIARHSLPRTGEPCLGSGTFLGDGRSRRLHQRYRRRYRLGRTSDTLGQTIAVTGGLVALITAFGFLSGARENQPPGSVQRSPYQYLTIRSEDPAEMLGCVGLLGLCIDQAFSQATEAFGQEQAEGMPKVSEDNPDEECHGWEPRNAEFVRVCEIDGAISTIAVDLLSAGPGNIALPHGVSVELPAGFRHVLEAFEDTEPPIELADLEVVPQSKYPLPIFRWYIARDDGNHYATIEVSGTEAQSMLPVIPACNLAAHLERFSQSEIKSIEVRKVREDDERGPCEDRIEMAPVVFPDADEAWISTSDAIFQVREGHGLGHQVEEVDEILRVGDSIYASSAADHKILRLAASSLATIGVNSEIRNPGFLLADESGLWVLGDEEDRGTSLFKLDASTLELLSSLRLSYASRNYISRPVRVGFTSYMVDKLNGSLFKVDLRGMNIERTWSVAPQIIHDLVQLDDDRLATIVEYGRGDMRIAVFDVSEGLVVAETAEGEAYRRLVAVSNNIYALTLSRPNSIVQLNGDDLAIEEIYSLGGRWEGHITSLHGSSDVVWVQGRDEIAPFRPNSRRLGLTRTSQVNPIEVEGVMFAAHNSSGIVEAIRGSTDDVVGRAEIGREAVLLDADGASAWLFLPREGAVAPQIVRVGPP
jgi:hypothetical protein